MNGVGSYLARWYECAFSEMMNRIAVLGVGKVSAPFTDTNFLSVRGNEYEKLLQHNSEFANSPFNFPAVDRGKSQLQSFALHFATQIDAQRDCFHVSPSS